MRLQNGFVPMAFFTLFTYCKSLICDSCEKKGSTQAVENALRKESYRQAFKPEVLSLSAEAAKLSPHAKSTLAKERP